MKACICECECECEIGREHLLTYVQIRTHTEGEREREREPSKSFIIIHPLYLVFDTPTENNPEKTTKQPILITFRRTNCDKIGNHQQFAINQLENFEGI